MRRSRTAVATALLTAALAAAGCGLGPGEPVGEVGLTITRDFGAHPLREPLRDEIAESDTVMRVLERNAEITTRYGGGFVQSIEGLEAAREGSGSWDWFFFVNGVESPVGAADYDLREDEEIWWDYRRWTTVMRVPAVVGSWPQPFAGGYEGRSRATELDCKGAREACRRVEGRLVEAGARLAEDGGAREAPIRVLVGPWPRLRRDPAAAQIEAGPQVSGVFAEFIRLGGRQELIGLDERGGATRRFGAGAGLVAATRRFEAPPTWVVTGTDGRGVLAAAGLLDAARLRDRYAIATAGGVETPLPPSR